MPSGIEFQCCREMEGIDEQPTEHGGDIQYITDEQFKVVCLNIDNIYIDIIYGLNKDVLYTALVTMKSVRGDSLRLPLANR